MLTDCNQCTKVRYNWVTEVFEGVAEPDRPMLIWEGGSLSYAQARRGCDGLLAWMRQKGLRPGQVVAVMSGLHPFLWITYLAAIKGGFQILPLSTQLTPEDLQYRFQLHPPGLVVGDQDHFDLLQGAAELALCCEEAHFDGPWVEGEGTHGEDPLFLFFTSGTTGLPKVVVHTQASYPQGHATTRRWIGLEAGDIHCNIAQPGWAKFAWSSFFAPLSAGASLFLPPAGRFDGARLLRALQEHKVTSLCAPPTAWRLLILEDLQPYRLHLRHCVSAGEPLNAEVIQTWRQGTGITIRDGYGQSETTLMVGNLPGQEVKPGSMGRPVSPYEIALLDSCGQPVPDLEEGEIAVALPSLGVFSGYASQSQANPFREGYYWTGDRAYRDGDGYFWFVGRGDDVIKASDYRIGPFEVESVLIEVPGVVEAAVVGVPHPLRGSEIKAFIVVQEGYQAEEVMGRLWPHCYEHLASYKRPRRVEVVGELPKTVSGKIRRVELRTRECDPEREFRAIS